MKRLFIGFMLLPVLFATAQEEPGEVDVATFPEMGEIVVCTITGVIEPGVVVLVERAVREAEERDAKAIIFRVDTPGGRVDSAVEIAAAIEGAPCRTIAFIEKMGAISAGALISFACDDMVMTPGSNIGAAAPVTITSEGMEPLGEKSKSYVRAKMRALAEANGHNPAIAEAMVDMDIELRAYEDEEGNLVIYSVDPPPKGEVSDERNLIEDLVDAIAGEKKEPEPVDDSEESETTSDAESGASDDRIIIARGKLLTLTPDEAKEYGVIEFIVKDLDEAVTQFMLGGGTYHTIEPNWAEKTYRFLTDPTIAGLLLMMGLGGMYFEVRTPGFGLPGMIAVVSLALLFGAHYVLGFTDLLDILLIVSGIALILVEVFVLPGMGIAGVLGFVALLAGSYLALVDFTIPRYSWEYDRLEEVSYMIVISGVGFVLLVIATWKLLPKTPLYNRLVLTGAMDTEAGYVSPRDADDTDSLTLGDRGTTTSMLRPAGKARFGDKTLDVVTRGAFIERGTPVELIQIDGGRYVVATVTEEKA